MLTTPFGIFPYLNASMGAEVEVKLCWMSDALVHSCSSRNVATLACLISTVSTEEAGVVTFLDNNECDAWLVVSLQLHAGRTHCTQLMGKNLFRKDSFEWFTNLAFPTLTEWTLKHIKKHHLINRYVKNLATTESLYFSLCKRKVISGIEGN